MDFFVTIDAFKVETARKGIRRMLRLIWTKSNNDEGKGVQTHLIDNYKGLFFDAPEMFTVNDAANFVARNMISSDLWFDPCRIDIAGTIAEHYVQSWTHIRPGHCQIMASIWSQQGNLQGTEKRSHYRAWDDRACESRSRSSKRSTPCSELA